MSHDFVLFVSTGESRDVVSASEEILNATSLGLAL